MKPLRINIDDRTYERLYKCLTHHGELSYILRETINAFIAKREPEIQHLQEATSGKGVPGSYRKETPKHKVGSSEKSVGDTPKKKEK